MVSDGVVFDCKVVLCCEWCVIVGVKVVVKVVVRNEVQVFVSDSGSESGVGLNGSSESIEIVSVVNKGVSNWDGRNGIECVVGSVVRVYEEVFFVMVFGCVCDDFVYCNVEESGGDVEICDSVYNRVCNIGLGSGSLC